MKSIDIVSQKRYKGVKWLLFLFLFIYLLLRTLYVDAVHDEIANYIYHFYHENYLDNDVHWNATNHLLNSFVDYQIYKVFGDNFIMFRIPNLLAFVLYFFGIDRLLNKINSQSLRTISLIALNTIPLILESFANARGHGLGIGFFVWAIVFVIRYFQTYEMKFLILGYAAAFFAVTSNITYVISSLILLFAAAIYPLINHKFRIKQQQIREWFVHAIFIIFLLPFINTNFTSFSGGKINYVSLGGLWDVTGKTLSRNILFYDSDWLMFPILFFMTAFFAGTIAFLFSVKFSNWLKNPITILSMLFFGNIVGIYLSATYLNINYPEDRSAMYLALLFLLLFIYLIDQFSPFIQLQYLLLFFPLSFLFHINLSTSVLDPNHRFDNEIYQKIKKELEKDPEHSITALF